MCMQVSPHGYMCLIFVLYYMYTKYILVYTFANKTYCGMCFIHYRREMTSSKRKSITELYGSTEK